MEFKDFSLGDRVKFKIDDYPETEGVVVFLDMSNKWIGIAHSENFGSNLGMQVIPQWMPNRYKVISNIKEYHNKPHSTINPSFYTITILGKTVTKAINPGCFCSVCGQFSPFSEPNQSDNTFKCYSCREQPLRAYY